MPLNLTPYDPSADLKARAARALAMLGSESRAKVECNSYLDLDASARLVVKRRSCRKGIT